MTIKEAREMAGLSRKEMAEVFKIPYRTLQNWELGSRGCPEWAEILIIEKLQRMEGNKMKKRMRYEVCWVGGERDGETLFATDDDQVAMEKAYELIEEYDEKYSEPEYQGIAIFDCIDPNHPVGVEDW